MKIIKRFYIFVCDLELVLVECIGDFVVILLCVFIVVWDGFYCIFVILGLFIFGVEFEQVDLGIIYYNVGYMFEVVLIGLDSQELLFVLSFQDLVVIYMNEVGECIVLGSL